MSWRPESEKRWDSHRDGLLPGQQELSPEITQLFGKHCFLKEDKIDSTEGNFFDIFQYEILL